MNSQNIPKFHAFCKLCQTSIIDTLITSKTPLTEWQLTVQNFMPVNLHLFFPQIRGVHKLSIFDICSHYIMFGLYMTVIVQVPVAYQVQPVLRPFKW